MFQKKTHTKDPEKKGHDHILAAAIMQKKKIGDLKINNSNKRNTLYLNHEDSIVKKTVCYFSNIIIIIISCVTPASFKLLSFCTL